MLILPGKNGKGLANTLLTTGDRLVEIRSSFFPNGEQRVRVVGPSAGEKVLVVVGMAIDPDKAIIQTLLLIDALKEGGAGSITLLIPFLGYSFQNKRLEGEAISVRQIGKVLSSSGADKIIVVDLHDRAELQYFDVEVENISLGPRLAEEAREELNGVEDACVVSPDQGSLTRASEFARILGLPLISMSKKRDSESLVVGEHQVKEGEVKKHCLVVDDAVNSGGTVVGVTRSLRAIGASRVSWYVTHFMGVPGSYDRIEKEIDLLVTTNTLDHGLVDNDRVRVIELGKKDLGLA